MRSVMMLGRSGLLLSAILSTSFVAASAAAGAAEPEIEGSTQELPFLQAVHQKVHKRWAGNFLPMLATLPPSSPLQDSGRVAVVTFTVDSRGEIGALKLAEPSGNGEFDAAALDVVKDSRPMAAAPITVVSDDGLAHLVWTFARDGRGCSKAKLAYPRLPIDQAVPRLLQLGKQTEALERIAGAEAPDAERGLSAFARWWLARRLTDEAAGMGAATALLRTGDRSQIDRVRAGLASPDLAAAAGASLRAAGVKVCPLVRASLASGAADQRRAAALALAGGVEDCAGALIELFGDDKAPVPARVAAAEALASCGDTAAHAVLSTAAQKAAVPAVRAAAILATVRPAAGRPALVRLVELLSNPAVELRAAAAGGAVRAAGDGGIEQLYKLFKDRSSEPLAAAAREAGKLSTEASAKFLAKLLRRPGTAAAAADALAGRTDAPARAAVAAALHDKALAAETRAMVVAGAEPADLAALATDAAMTRGAFKAFLVRKDRGGAARWLAAHTAAFPPDAMQAALIAWLP